MDRQVSRRRRGDPSSPAIVGDGNAGSACHRVSVCSSSVCHRLVLQLVIRRLRALQYLQLPMFLVVAEGNV